MTVLHDSLAEYLAVRRALGYKLERTERLLGQFLDYLDATGADRITVEHALTWATLPGGRTPLARDATRSGPRVRAVPARSRPARRLPAADLLPDKSGRAVPYLYTDEQIAALMHAAGTLRVAHKTATFQTLFGLLVATGMRVGEAVALGRSDFNADAGALTVRNAKFGKSRELPLHPTTTEALTRYLARRDRPTAVGPTEALLVSTVGTRLLMSDVQTCFRALRARAGILPRSAACRPRLHDLRHSFAVRTLLDAYRTDGDPGPRIATLSTYLGHVNPGKTYWYLHAAPELLQLASGRLQRHLGAGE